MPCCAQLWVKLERAEEHFFQLLIGSAEKYTASISAIKMGMIGKVTQHTICFATAARAAIKDFKDRTA